MMEYTREMFNSNCDIQFIKSIYQKLIENNQKIGRYDVLAKRT